MVPVQNIFKQNKLLMISKSRFAMIFGHGAIKLPQKLFPGGPLTPWNIFNKLYFTFKVLVHNIYKKNKLKCSQNQDFQWFFVAAPSNFLKNSSLGAPWPPRIYFTTWYIHLWCQYKIFTKKISFNALKIEIFNDFCCSTMKSPQNSPLGTPCPPKCIFFLLVSCLSGPCPPFWAIITNFWESWNWKP